MAPVILPSYCPLPSSYSSGSSNGGSSSEDGQSQNTCMSGSFPPLVSCLTVRPGTTTSQFYIPLPRGGTAAFT